MFALELVDLEANPFFRQVDLIEAWASQSKKFKSMKSNNGAGQKNDDYKCF